MSQAAGRGGLPLWVYGTGNSDPKYWWLAKISNLVRERTFYMRCMSLLRVLQELVSAAMVHSISCMAGENGHTTPFLPLPPSQEPCLVLHYFGRCGPIMHSLAGSLKLLQKHLLEPGPSRPSPPMYFCRAMASRGLRAENSKKTVGFSVCPLYDLNAFPLQIMTLKICETLSLRWSSSCWAP